MEFKQLHYFVSVVDEKSFTRAANKLHVSQPALSKMIRLLENDIGAQLLLRSNKQFKLTEIGEEVYTEGKRIIKEFEFMNEYTKTLLNFNVGKISVGVPPVIGSCLLPSFLSKFYLEFPKIELKFFEEGANIIQNKVYSEEVDVGIAILPVNNKKFDITPIVEGENVLVLHKSHRLSARKRISTYELKDEEFLIFDQSYTLHHNILSACNNQGFEPKIKFIGSNWDLLMELAILKQGITILPKTIVDKYKSSEVIKINISDEILKWKIVAITKKNRLINNSTRKFITFMKANAKL